ncbi:MAG: hypothetical protein OEV44_12745, partial [Spirochaetota bacterium]|nr:hypothetical protein [Spirochaetota bacterium]
MKIKVIIMSILVVICMSLSINFLDAKNKKIDLTSCQNWLKKLGRDFSIDELKELNSLSLYGKEIKDEDLIYLTSLSNLEELNLSYTKITDAGLIHLKDIKKLKMLIIGKNKLQDQD